MKTKNIFNRPKGNPKQGKKNDPPRRLPLTRDGIDIVSMKMEYPSWGTKNTFKKMVNIQLKIVRIG